MSHSAEKDAGLPALAQRCRNRLDALPDWALPSWYLLRVRRATRPLPPAEKGRTDA